jgi:ribosomal protein L10
MDKAGKAAALETYKNVFAKAGVIVVTQYSGLTVA